MTVLPSLNVTTLGKFKQLYDILVFLVSRSRRNERNLHTEDLGDLVDIDLREDDLLGDCLLYTSDVYKRQA